jgi:methyl-accepting chemotaxis protein
MSETAIPSGRALRARALAWSAGLSLVSVLMIALYLVTLLDLSRAEWRGFGWIVGSLLLLAFLLYSWVNKKNWASILRCLERRYEARASRDDLRSGFQAASNLPIYEFYSGVLVWAGSGILVAILMAVLWGVREFFTSVIIVAAALSGGLVACIFHYYIVKRLLEPVRETLAREVGEADERRALVRRVPLTRKLLVSVTVVTLVVVVFAIFVAEIRSGRGVEEQVTRIQGNFLAEIAPRVDADGAPVIADVARRARRLGIADGLGILSADGEKIVAGDLNGILASEIAAMRESGLRQGDSVAFRSPNVFSWHRLPRSGGVLVAVTSSDTLRGAVWKNRAVFAMLLFVSTVLSVGVARLIARDVSSATVGLTVEADRMASGDLRPGRVLESEDEIGELSRAFENMGRFLRVTVRRVAEAADRVEDTAGELASVSQSLAAVTADQVTGTRQAAASMEAINAQVRGITDSSRALSLSVEESSSTILELGAAGEQLNDTASILSSQVEDVSSSIEQMVRSVKHVAENTESLTEAAVDTSTRMSEMAGAMRAVDATAGEAVELSRQVVSISESGQGRVSETIRGMEAIRRTTQTVAEAIESLGVRTKEIGAIVDVIDDVADETNLLALNAAIIAAQAGEQGRGFAVVAREIKDLADRVLASTKEIGLLIASVQDESDRAIGAVAEGTRSVASGVALSAQAGESLEEITRSSRESGSRIGGILAAVQEQAGAAARVAELMEQVREGVDAIRAASEEQNRGHEVVYRGSLTMREVAQQVRGTTEEQARGAGRIRDAIEEVRSALERINAALEEQSAACRSAVEFVEQVATRTRSNQESTRRLTEATGGLQGQAEALRADLDRFQF